MECLSSSVMVRAWSHSFWRTIKGQLWWSLQWWPTHHCSVPPLPPATLVGLISELHRNTSSTPIPPTNLHSYHFHYQPAPSLWTPLQVNNPNISGELPHSPGILMNTQSNLVRWISQGHTCWMKFTCLKIKRRKWLYTTVNLINYAFKYSITFNINIYSISRSVQIITQAQVRISNTIHYCTKPTYLTCRTNTPQIYKKTASHLQARGGWSCIMIICKVNIYIKYLGLETCMCLESHNLVNQELNHLVHTSHPATLLCDQ